jgi:hypothetical protein
VLLVEDDDFHDSQSRFAEHADRPARAVTQIETKGCNEQYALVTRATVVTIC